ncbi:protein S100-A1-like [Lethenteron reissneri]|uniref:protein S100-A1-like n=1 Tax=Lethenteron reissneri TaxID=7753 RepID=UPI002AB6775C|nr:protein S100-A1-like [Lethenteron reissneri]
MCDLHAATLKLLSIFHELAHDNAVKDCLKKGKFRSFLKGDKGKSLIQNPVDGFVVSRILRDLGDDKDGEVEFVITIAALKFCCHPNFRAHHERNGRIHALTAFKSNAAV